MPHPPSSSGICELCKFWTHTLVMFKRMWICLKCKGEVDAAIWDGTLGKFEGE